MPNKNPAAPGHLIRVLVALACAAGSGSLQAVTSCNINSVALTFPTYDVFTPNPTDSIGTVDLGCTNMDTSSSPAANLTVSLGSGSNGSIPDRKMAGNGSLLHYGIYSDAARARIWGQGSEAVQQITGPFQANETKTVRIPLYARIPAQQNVRAGTYSDVILITITP